MKGEKKRLGIKLYDSKKKPRKTEVITMTKQINTQVTIFNFQLSNQRQCKYREMINSADKMFNCSSLIKYVDRLRFVFGCRCVDRFS